MVHIIAGKHLPKPPPARAVVLLDPVQPFTGLLFTAATAVSLLYYLPLVTSGQPIKGANGRMAVTSEDLFCFHLCDDNIHMKMLSLVLDVGWKSQI